MNLDEIKMNIAITDDNIHDHNFIKTSVSEYENIRFSSFYSGDELINYLLKQREHEGNKDPAPDLILLDINMPGLSGFEVIEFLSANSSFDMARFVILSTSIEPDLSRCGKLDLMAYNKPASWNQYGQLMKRIIGDFLGVEK
jgi:CheY-like chemotaxis protein